MVSTDLQVHGTAPFKRIVAEATVESPFAHSVEQRWGKVEVVIHSFGQANQEDSYRLTEFDRRNIQRFPIFGNRPASDDDALLPQQIRNLAIRKRFSSILGINQLFDQRTNGRGGARTTRLGCDMAAKEVFELEDATRRCHVLRVVTRDTVDSCKPRISAISRRTSGRMATSPWSKN